MEPSVAANVMSYTTAKGVWNDLQESFSQDTNLSRVYDLYERLFNCKQGDRSIAEFYSSLKGIWEELNVHQPLTTDLNTLKAQRAKFQVATFLSSLSSELQPLKSQLLAGDKVLTLNEAFFCV